MINYNIQIQNRSGRDQSYILFNEAPRVVGPSQKIWPVVLSASRTPNWGSTRFDFADSLFATCGRTSRPPTPGTAFRVNVTRPVQAATSRPGTALGLVFQHGASYFGPTATPSEANSNAFVIQTEDDFTVIDAHAKNLMIGLARQPGDAECSPVAVFTPEPNVRYQIQPVNKYYIACGDMRPGELVEMHMFGQFAAVDFTRSGPSVEIVHNERGEMVVQSD